MHALPRLWRETDFRWLFLSQTISTTGDRIVLVALALLVTERTGSTTDLGIVIAAQTIALVTFLLLGGVWADRLPRHRIMVATDLVRGGLHALLALLIFTDAVEIWHLVVIEFGFGAAEAFFRPAYSGLVPQTVPEDLIQEANAANGLTQTLAEFAGPAIATALVLTLGTGWAFAVDSASFMASAVLLLFVTPRPRGEPTERTTLLAELRAGWREVRARAWVWVTIAVFSLNIVFAYAPYVVLGPSVAADRYGDPATWGWIASSVGAGTALGALLALRWRPSRPLLIGILLCVPFGIVLAALAIGIPLAVLIPGVLASGVGVALFGVWWETALAQRIPPAALGRVASYDWMGSMALLPIGYLLIGVLADQIGATEVMGVAGLLGAAVVLVALIPRETRALRRIEGGAEPPLHSGLTHGTAGDLP